MAKSTADRSVKMTALYSLRVEMGWVIQVIQVIPVQLVPVTFCPDVGRVTRFIKHPCLLHWITCVENPAHWT